MISRVSPTHLAVCSPANLADYLLMSDPELDAHLPALLANRAVSAYTAVFVLDEWLSRRQTAAEMAPQQYLLTKAEVTCIDILNLDAQICNGGIEQWLYNGYGYRANETLEALRIIGADELERILERALDILPHPVRDRLMTQTHSGYLGWLELSLQEENGLDGLTTSYGKVRNKHVSLTDQLAEFARIRRVGPAARELACCLPAASGPRVRA